MGPMNIRCIQICNITLSQPLTPHPNYNDLDHDENSTLRVCLVGMKRERKEKGGGKMENYVFGMERKMEGREKWVENFMGVTHKFTPINFNPPKSGRKMEGKRVDFLG